MAEAPEPFPYQRLSDVCFAHVIEDVKYRRALDVRLIFSTFQREKIMSIFSRIHRRRKSSAARRSALLIAAECVEERMLLSAAPIDGTGNNLQHPEWGSTGEDLLRLAKAEYADAISAVGGEDRPSARLISNTVSDAEGQDVISDRMMSAKAGAPTVASAAACVSAPSRSPSR